MHQYSTATAHSASPPPPSSLVAFPVPRKAAKRVGVLRAWAKEVLADGALTMTPLAPATDAAEEQMVLDAYLFAGEASAFEQLSRAMVMPNGWAALLGRKASLIHGLRALQQRRFDSGDYTRWLKISHAEMATLVGVDKRTIARWLAPGPDLDTVLSDYMKQQAARDSRGRKKKPALEPLRCALLRLFIRETRPTGYTTAQGQWRRWVNSYRVSPIDPLVGTQEELLLTLLDGGQVNGEESGGGEDETEMRLCQRERTLGAVCPSRMTDGTPRRLSAFSARRMVRQRCHRAAALRRQNVRKSLEFPVAPAMTQCHGFLAEAEREIESSSGCTSHRVIEPGTPESFAHAPTRTHTHTRMHEGGKGLERTGEETREKYTSAHAPTHTHAHTHAHAHVRTRGRPRTYTREEQAAWYAQHAGAIADYKAACAPYLADFVLGDRTPHSTLTRCGRLFAGAATPFEQVAEILAAAYEQARTGRGSHLVKRDGPVFRRTPRFLRALQALLGGAENPAYCSPQWGQTRGR